jgi:dihydroorotate dehydrogenase
MTTAPLRVMGIELANPVGVAAGYDRDGSRLAELSEAGFGFVEVGTINVMAGPGATAMLQPVVANLACHRVRSAPPPGGRGAVVGVSIGSLRDTLDTVAAAEFTVGAHALAPLADYLVVNLSRPGSACRDGGGDAQSLQPLLERIRVQIDATSRALSRRIPLLVKVAARANDAEPIPEAARLAAMLGYDGVLAAFERWPSAESICSRIAALRQGLAGVSIICVGGVKTAAIAMQYLNAGADLVQIYTALSERGSGVARKLTEGLQRYEVSELLKSAWADRRPP